MKKDDRLVSIKHGKCGSLVVRVLAFSAKGHGFDPRSRQGKISSKIFLSIFLSLYTAKAIISFWKVIWPWEAEDIAQVPKA